MDEELEIKTHEQMHEMTFDELKQYIYAIYRHVSEATAIRDYRDKIGEPKLLALNVVDVEDEEE
jgi:hypothetical protein